VYIVLSELSQFFWYNTYRLQNVIFVPFKSPSLLAEEPTNHKFA
jgi:hypothetical protein